MTNQLSDGLSEETVRILLDLIAPGSVILSIDALSGANVTHRVAARSGQGAVFRIVIHRYVLFGNYDRGEKARREFTTLELLHKHGIPVPQPLYLDATGAILGMPGIVTRYVPGEQIAAPTEALRWVRLRAQTLAQIHSIPCESTLRPVLLDANAEVVWFLKSGVVPDYMTAHPDGEVVWHTVHDLVPHLQPVPASLVHLDYGSGNILWDQGHITAVLDWEEAAYGDPAIDVAYSRMDLVLSGMGQVAEAFLQAYEAEMGRRVANLGVWELAAAARPMFNQGHRIAESPGRELFRAFIGEALRQRA